MNATQRKIIVIAGGALLAVNVGLNLLLWGRASRLERQLDALRSQSESQYLSLQDQLLNRLDSLSDQISSGESLLSYWDTQVDMGDNHQLSATVVVTPKEIGEGDSVEISIGDVSTPAVESGGSYTATLSISASPYELVPVVTILTTDGTRKQEVLPSVSTAEFFEIYYSYDITVKDGTAVVKAGFQPAVDSILTIPDDIAHVWLIAEDQDGGVQEFAMEPDGNRIPDAAGITSEPESSSTAKAQETDSADAAVSSSLYYAYYTVTISLPEDGSSYNLNFCMETASGIRFTVNMAQVNKKTPNGFSGSGDIYPDWEDESES